MKTRVISPGFRARYVSEPGGGDIIETRTILFEGSDHYRINDPALRIDENGLVVMCGADPIC